MSLLRPLLPGLLLALAPAVPAQREGGDLARELAALSATAAETPAGDLWRKALEVEALGVRAGRAELDGAIDRMLGQGGLDEASALLLATVRVRGEGWDAQLLAAALAPLVDSEDPDLAALAIALLGDSVYPADDLTEDEPRLALAGRLLELARDADRGGVLRVRSAAAAYALGDGPQKRSARAELVTARKDEDPAVAAEAVLSLAGMGEPVIGTVKEDLEGLARLPGEPGALARSFLENARVRELGVQRYQALQQLYDEALPTQELKDFDAVMAMVEALHLDGDKFDREELKDLALDGMLRSLDPHSSYLPSKQYEAFYFDTFDPNYGGIGAYINIDPEDGLPTISRPIYSGPAYREGLMTDDKIVRVDGFPTIGEPLDEVTTRMKGRPGTPVRLYVWRRGMDPGWIERPTDEMAIDVVREEIALPTVAWQMLPGRVGLIELQDFSAVASSALAQALVQMTAEGLDALVLDLRYNGGGVLQQARNVADLFLERNQLVVTTEYRAGEPQRLYTQAPALVPAEIPMIVLVNRFSASASEIVAGALHDHGRAKVFGERSFGKGAIQNLLPVIGTEDDVFEDENGNGLYDTWERLVVDQNGNGKFDFAPRVRLTVGRYRLPSGRSIHRELDRDRNVVWIGGIEPDREVEMSRIEGWRWQERRRIAAELHPKHWVNEHWDGNEALFRRLALCDEKDPALYPGFDAFYAGLETVLPRDDVRLLLRAELRRRFQDERGGAYPFGDFQEDPQVQAAIADLLLTRDRAPRDFPEYASTFDTDEPAELDRLVALGPNRAEVDRRLEELRTALAGDGQVGRETLEGIRDLLDKLDD